jgi:hypothetical protein
MAAAPPSAPTRRGRSARVVASAVLLVAALALAGCAQRSEAQGAPPAGPEPVLEPTVAPPAPTSTTVVAAHPKVLVLGDSTMVDVGPALVAALDAAGAEPVDAARAGVGLTRFAFEDAPYSPEPEWAVEVDRVRPDLTIVMLGAWDMPFVTNEGIWPYTEPVQRAMATLTAGGGRVLWLSTPTEPGRPDWPMDQVFETSAAATGGRVVFAEIDAAVTAPDGTQPPSYVAADGTVVRLRKSDGFHFCAEGAERAAAEIVRLAHVHGLAPPPGGGWQDGPWRESEHYDFPECDG